MATITTARQVELINEADAAYDRDDQDWFNRQDTADLLILWNLVSGENLFSPAGSWDDEVHDALFLRGHF